jgi:hypothetical protein
MEARVSGGGERRPNERVRGRGEQRAAGVASPRGHAGPASGRQCGAAVQQANG